MLHRVDGLEFEETHYRMIERHEAADEHGGRSSFF